MIDPDIRNILRSQLHHGEKIIWAGRPQKHPVLVYLFVIPFLLIFVWAFPIQLGLAILQNDPSSVHMTINDVPVDANTPMSTIRITFFLTTGLLVPAIFAVFFYVRWRMREVYALTNESAVITRTSFPFQFVRIRPQAFDYIIRSGNKDVGTLSFMQSDNKPLGRFIRNLNSDRIKFHNITEPIKVETLIYKQFLSMKKEPQNE